MNLKRFKELVRLQSYECKNDEVVKVKMSQLSEVVTQIEYIEDELIKARMANTVLARQIQSFKDCNLRWLDETA